MMQTFKKIDYLEHAGKDGMSCYPHGVRMSQASRPTATNTLPEAGFPARTVIIPYRKER
jgi:hypothetical protein